MDLLFKTNTEQDFSNDFKSSLGFVDADIPLIKIKPDLLSATRTIIKTIGQETYDAIHTNNQLQDSNEQKDKTLDFFAKYAIATEAYSLFAPSNDLAHSPNGRKMRTADDTKTPFEWMMVRDDDNLKRRAYRALDDLIKYMDDNLEAWKTSEECKKSHKLFVRTVEDFSLYYQLESRLLLLKLYPALNSFEKKQIKSRIGEETFTDLKTRAFYFATTALEDEQEPEHEPLDDDELLLIELIKEASVYHALSWGLPRLQLTLFPEGVLQQVRGDRFTVKARVSPANMQVDQMSQLFKEDTQAVLLEIEELYKEINPPTEEETTQDKDQIIAFGFTEDDNFVNT